MREDTSAMELWLLGGLHDGLLMRRRCVNWLREAAGRYRQKPRFIAVEWGKAAYESLSSHRPYLEQQLNATWPNAALDVIDAASASLCWEAEAALEAFRQPPPITWLEEGINAQLESIPIKNPTFYIDNAKVAPMRNLMGSPSQSASLRQAISAFSASEASMWPTWEAAMATRRDRDVRERAWAVRLHNIKRARSKRAWAAAIVGAAHATRFDQHSLPSELDRLGNSFRVHFFAEPIWYKRTG
jgi:hypothetical protein